METLISLAPDFRQQVYGPSNYKKPGRGHPKKYRTPVRFKTGTGVCQANRCKEQATSVVEFPNVTPVLIVVLCKRHAEHVVNQWWEELGENLDG